MTHKPMYSIQHIEISYTDDAIMDYRAWIECGDSVWAVFSDLDSGIRRTIPDTVFAEFTAGASDSAFELELMAKIAAHLEARISRPSDVIYLLGHNLGVVFPESRLPGESDADAAKRLEQKHSRLRMIVPYDPAVVSREIVAKFRRLNDGEHVRYSSGGEWGG